jgi:ABC-type glycerol-3-phosphate transport system permease component
MDPSPLLELAHAGHGIHGPVWALAAIAIAAMVIPMIILVFVGRYFIRAAKRDEKARLGGQGGAHP